MLEEIDKMKATGVIRRVDDLGRIIIPKSVRKELNIKEGEPMELFIDGNDVVFRKYTFDNCENETCNCDACVKNGDCIEQGIDGEVMEHCVQGSCSNFKSVEQIKTEAYKEFAERIKLSIKANVVETLCNDVRGVYKAEYVLDDIDNLLKELVGEE